MIDEHSFFPSEDHRTWRGRKIKGDLRSYIKTGLITASWNKWVTDHGGKGVATVAGASVGCLDCYVTSMNTLTIHVQVILRNTFASERVCWRVFALGRISRTEKKN